MALLSSWLVFNSIIEETSTKNKLNPYGRKSEPLQNAR